MDSLIRDSGEAAVPHFTGFRWAGDGLALAGVAASWAQILTPYSTILAFFYLCIRVYADRTIVRQMFTDAIGAVRKLIGR